MPIACVLIPHFIYHAHARRQPELRQGPVILAADQGARKMVADCSPQIAGLRTGMPLAAALAVAGNARVVEADQACQRQEFQEVLQALQQRCPAVEPAGLGCAYLDLTGLEGLYGGDAHLALALQRALPPEFPAQVGIGTNKFVAYLAAQLAQYGNAFQAPADARAFVQQFPVECLPVSAAVIARLRQFGFKTLGDVAALDIGPLQTQFGPQGKRMWELAKGVDSRPVMPMKEEDTVSASLFLPCGNASLDLLLLGLEVLARKLLARKEVMGKYAGHAAMACAAAGFPTWQRSYAFKERLGTIDKLLPALKSRLLPDPPRFPVEELSLALSDMAGETGAQGLLLEQGRTSGDGLVATLAQRLQARGGGMPSLYRVVNVAPDHPLPEMRYVLAPLNPESTAEVRPVNQPVLAQVVKEGQELALQCPQGGAGEQAPVRATVQDLWKVDLWWLPCPASRTYYRATGPGGKQFTMFQDNLSGHWYLQQP
ncbi:MAG: hypothetical protein FJ316_00040 [SAR202 cluster bacterium]|nr:hypothetical protein [SAR202 cluster bacterium]